VLPGIRLMSGESLQPSASSGDACALKNGLTSQKNVNSNAHRLARVNGTEIMVGSPLDEFLG